jgi:hypothetical protein
LNFNSYAVHISDDKDNITGPASQGKVEDDVKQTLVTVGDVEMPSDDEDDGDLQIVEQGNFIL